MASFTRDGAVTLANYETVRRLYARDVAYTIGVAAAGTALTFARRDPRLRLAPRCARSARWSSS